MCESSTNRSSTTYYDRWLVYDTVTQLHDTVACLWYSYQLYRWLVYDTVLQRACVQKGTDLWTWHAQHRVISYGKPVYKPTAKQHETRTVRCWNVISDADVNTYTLRHTWACECLCLCRVGVHVCARPCVRVNVLAYIYLCLCCSALGLTAQLAGQTKMSWPKRDLHWSQVELNAASASIVSCWRSSSD